MSFSNCYFLVKIFNNFFVGNIIFFHNIFVSSLDIAAGESIATFLAAQISSRSLVVGRSVGRLVGWSVGLAHL